MYFKMIVIAMMAMVTLSCSNSDNSQDPENMDTPKSFMDSVSYSLGKNMAMQMNQDDLEINIMYFAAGYLDGKDTSRNQLIANSEIPGLNQRFQLQVQQQQEIKRRRDEADLEKRAEENIAQGENLMRDTKNKPEWNETPTGLLYKVVNEGQGDNAKISDVATLHMIGAIPDGTEFENTWEAADGEPIEIPVFQMVPGFQEAIAMLKKGSKYEFIVPANIAFGEQGIQGIIPPNTPIMLTLELVDTRDGSEEFEQHQRQMEMMQQQGMGR